MNFIAPLFLAGAAAVALPLFFHLIRRSSREKIIFSSLMFLEPSPPRLTKRSRLEHILLLILRAAVVCLLAFAFARPFFQKPFAADAAPDQNLRVAVLVDSSGSMRREDLWNRSVSRAVEILRGLKPADSVGLYTFDEQLRTILSFAEAGQLSASERPGAAEARLKAVAPGWSSTRLGHAMLSATEHLLEDLNRDSREQGNTKLRLVVISDFQSGARLEGLQGFEWPKKLEVQLETIGAKELSNAGLQVLEEKQQLFSAVTNAPLRLRVSNAAQSQAEQLTLRWRRGGESSPDPTPVYVPAGQSRIVSLAAVPTNAEAVTLSGDRVDFDNAVYLARPRVSPVTVAYYGSERADDPAGMRYYIHRAFEQTNLSTRVHVIGNTVTAEARQSSMLILCETPTPEVLDLSKALLQEGRTVVLALRNSADANAISSLAGGLLVAAPEAEVSNYALLGRISFQHPLFAPFADARFNDFTKIHFWKYRALNLANITNATAVAALDSGTPLISEIPVEKGRLMVFATTWRPEDSQLALSSKFVPLLFGLLEQSAGIRSIGHLFNVGDRVALPPEFQGEVRLPDGTMKAARGLFADTQQPGVYTAGDYQFAVNLDPSESRISPLTVEEFKSLGVPLNLQADARETVLAEQRQRHRLASETEARQKLWRNFLLAAIAFVLLETWIAGRLSRRLAAAPA